jgi:hypothetical protein
VFSVYQEGLRNIKDSCSACSNIVELDGAPKKFEKRWFKNFGGGGQGLFEQSFGRRQDPL